MADEYNSKHTGNAIDAAVDDVINETVKTKASLVTFNDGQTFQQKLDNGSLKGQQGEKGADGAKGDTGAAGTAATIAVGNVSTGAAGSKAAVTNVGSETAAKFDFTIPQGAKGDKGDKGDDGAPGAKGSDGKTPVKGVDYFTQSDIDEIVDDVLSHFTDVSKIAM